MEAESAHDRVDRSFRQRYGSPLSEYEVSETPGYWRKKEVCGGATGGCRAEIHSCLFNEGGIHHTASYRDSSYECGRFVSPYRSWRELGGQE